MTVVLFFLFTFWLFLGPALGRGRMSSGEEGCLSSCEVDVDGPGESVGVYGGSLLLSEAAAATGGVDLCVT
jgi:hypothetical protein